MYLKSIEINGFKSFAKKSELVFTSSISSIVGPNGSGKSNIAEAFRFVLGEQSIKSLRGKKGEDLIWNGSSEVMRAGRASVKVTFDNRDKFLPIEFSEVTIERIVHRDGINEYLLNASQVRLKDIAELLASAHIGSGGHHIISQGEADRILNASLMERKSMIEDALGLRVYQYKKIESEKKLLKTKENIVQIESLRREIVPHLKFLKKQVEKMEKGEEIRKELLRVSREYLSFEKQYIDSEKERINEIKRPLLQTLAEVRKEVLLAKEILEKNDNKDFTSNELLSIEEKIEKVRSDKNIVLQDIGRIDGEIASALRSVKRQEEQNLQKEWKTVELRAVKDLYKEIEEHIGVIENSNDSEKIKDSVNIIRSIISAFIEMHEDRIDNKVLVEARLEIENLQKEKEIALLRKDRVDQEEKNFQLEYQKIKQKVENEKDTNRDAEKNLFKAMAEEQSVLGQMKEVNVKEDVVEVLHNNFKRDLAELAGILGKEILGFENDPVKESSRQEQEDKRRNIEKMKIRFEESGAIGGEETLKEYNDAKQRDEFLANELLDLENSAKSLLSLIEDLDIKLSEEFKNGIDKINSQFKEFFTLMFGGGEASLTIVGKEKKKKIADGILESGSENVVEEEQEERGIDIDVSLPRKKVRGLLQLSGGERALTSIALLFAISQVNPPPFIILDETDAALDEANSRKYGDMIENLGKFSQLIVITHNRETMSRAGVLYGVTMTSGGVSKLISVAFEEAVAVAK